MKRVLFLLLLLSNPLFANKVVNVYLWGGTIPKQIIHQFEHDTGITIHFSTFDSNETMYAKLKASSKPIYDVILPSAYFVERMMKQGLLTPLDHNKLPNSVNIDKHFQDNSYDPKNHYSVPLVWGTTGIFFNKGFVSEIPSSWKTLWDERWRHQLMLLDDSREVFSMALMSLGFDPNDTTPQHIEAAYNHLLQLVPNIKLFASDSIQAIMIDEDAPLGLSWNNDAIKANIENKQIGFSYPREGFVIWADCLAIPSNPPHLKEAYQFINYMLSARVSMNIAKAEGAAITNAKGLALLPEEIRNNQIIYPSAEVLKRGYFQRDVGEETLALYNKYWQQLKLAF